ncbi:hypothetical protein EVAR_65123_1 [Eumeta japonica]|uniref:Uncharacterized protein n=1 Tax=Eumeta variegata TaxID=151549 RepID=A0A4C1Z9Z9_EUMVA|nr:hypothetical protein EVAR_65123_1 [Eumeta japonica]
MLGRSRRSEFYANETEQWRLKRKGIERTLIQNMKSNFISLQRGRETSATRRPLSRPRVPRACACARTNVQTSVCSSTRVRRSIEVVKWRPAIAARGQSAGRNQRRDHRQGQRSHVAAASGSTKIRTALHGDIETKNEIIGISTLY